ncbi:MAG: hypothetical protein LQ351_002240 [Letrouitia transgressa]|nr:MAG: hypothetical protein LQ351_002240 [Letrouitia transgressa]
MSIFSKIRGAKKAADKHKQEQASAGKKEGQVPYRHIPTHAAVDALTGAPSSWREEDRAAIKHQHKRRSMMSRNSSALSTLHPSSSYAGSEFSSYGMMPAGGVSPTGSEHSNSSSSSQLIELPASNQRHSTQYGQHLTPVEHMHKNTTRKLGEAPLWDAPPPRPTPVKTPSAAATSTSVNSKKRSWSFAKRNSQMPAIAAH